MILLEELAPTPSIPLGNVAIGDLDGDGRPDLAFLHVYSSPPAKGLPTTYNSVINILKNIAIDENIAFQIIGGNNIPGSFFEFGYSLASYVSYVAISDLDGDGKPDLAVSKIDSSVSIFKNSSVTGSISFAGKVDFGTGLNTRSIVIGDLNGDSKPDLAFANSFTSTVSALKNEIDCITPPSIVAFSPSSGPVGTTVIITGKNFDPVPANNIVYFGAVMALPEL